MLVLPDALSRPVNGASLHNLSQVRDMIPPASPRKSVGGPSRALTATRPGKQRRGPRGR